MIDRTRHDGRFRAVVVALVLSGPFGASGILPGEPGRLEIVPLESQIFGNNRNLRIWLPDEYDDPGNSRKSYPVLYLNDGQNLFDSATALLGTSEWRVDETMASLLGAGEVAPVIVVGIDNAGRRGRAREYLPYPDEFLEPPEPNPAGHLYGDFLAEEVIPLVEQRYRTLRGRGGRVLGGSSYGALVSLHVVVSRSDLFSGLLLESPSFYVDDAHILQDASAADLDIERIYVGVGTNELALEGCPDHAGNREPVNDVRRFAEILLAAGMGEDQILVRIEECAVHDEDAWARRLPDALRFLFPAEPLS